MRHAQKARVAVPPRSAGGSWITSTQWPRPLVDGMTPSAPRFSSTVPWPDMNLFPTTGARCAVAARVVVAVAMRVASMSAAEDDIAIAPQVPHSLSLSVSLSLSPSLFRFSFFFLLFFLSFFLLRVPFQTWSSSSSSSRLQPLNIIND